MQQARDAEIRQARATLGVEQHVFWLDVSVHDATRVRVCKRAAQLFDDPLAVFDAQRQARAQRAARDVLHDQVASAVRERAKVVNGHDVRMAQARQHARFTLEARLKGGIERELCRQQLDRHFAIELGVARAKDAPHAAASDLFQQLQALRVFRQGLGLVQSREQAAWTGAERVRRHCQPAARTSGGLVCAAHAAIISSRAASSSSASAESVSVSATRLSSSSRKRTRARCTNAFSCGTLIW